MSEAGFQRIQRQFAAHIRDPRCPAPGDIEDRRLAIYRDLFYNNIESFLHQGFPVLRAVLDDQQWHALVRAFLEEHGCSSPYFVRIPEEFVSWLASRSMAAYPDWLVELAHYEYMELAIAVADEDFPAQGINAGGDMMLAAPVVSPLACVLSYQWPVQRIGPAWQPAGKEPVWLLVHRDREDQVRFTEINAVTARLLTLCQEQPLLSGRDVLCQLAEELGQDAQTVCEFGADLFRDLRAADIILGTRLDTINNLQQEQ
ncbi:MAG: putative DNA-binding domain-containing protein [Alcanivoracaceae bacterium]|nr:putative DNA-binding domain-containing protein [Alcanivoracaceae bacterium]